jgi:nuclear pore complex protein Nup62
VIEPPPVEYQSLTVEQILNKFQSELETDTIAFLQEAQRIACYDATLRDTQYNLSQLVQMTSRLFVHQQEVDAQLQGIGSYQKELATTLDQLEQNVDELFAAQSGISVQDVDIERERAYERALEIDSKLGQMSNVLENVVGELNAAQERVWSMSRGQDGSNKEIGEIIRVFNSHNETLIQLDAKARNLEADVTMVNQVLARSGL